MSSRTAFVLVACILLPVAPSLAQQTCYGPGDINADARVTLGDFDVFSLRMHGPDVTPPAPDPEFWRSDLDDDADVDLGDFGRFAPLMDTQYFDYGVERENTEAELLAMQLSGQLRAPDAEYDRILRDLALIHATYSQLAGVGDDPDWVPNQLIVKVLNALPHDGYEALNAYYLVTEIDQIFGEWYTLTFCDNLNPAALGPIYAALPEVQYADPNGLIGIDDYITISVIGTTYRYDIDDGFHDCFDGCDCHRYWVIDVDAFGLVTLVSYQEYGMSWCVF